ncbi:MAG: 5-formyltetrahydrofolate cyclo-ligase [Armatimonadaceae bacterium]
MGRMVPDPVWAEGKPAIRQWARDLRRGLEIASISRRICERLASTTEFRGASHILLFAAMPDEVDVLSLVGKPDAVFYLPRCAPGRRLVVHRYVPGRTVLRSGPFGISEPDPDRECAVDPGVIDLVVVPALAVDRSGVRLGYGGGYYDRFLAGLEPTVATVAVVPDDLLVDHLPSEPWDIDVKLICTERRFLPKINGGDAEGMV